MDQTGNIATTALLELLEGELKFSESTSRHRSRFLQSLVEIVKAGGLNSPEARLFIQQVVDKTFLQHCITDDEFRSAARQSVSLEIDKERQHQDELWGGTRHDDQHRANAWLLFISRYVGKAVDSIYRMKDAPRKSYRHRMIQIAALAVAAVEWIDRNCLEGLGYKR